MSESHEVRVRALDEYYTAIREKRKQSNFQISYEDAEREVQKDAIKEND